MDMTKIFYAYDENGNNVWVDQATDVLAAYKAASLATGIQADKLSVERA